jgi:hypothetical protein
MLASETVICMVRILRSMQLGLSRLVKVQQLLDCGMDGPVCCVGLFLSDIGSPGKYLVLLVETFLPNPRAGRQAVAQVA